MRLIRRWIVMVLLCILGVHSDEELKTHALSQRSALSLGSISERVHEMPEEDVVESAWNRRGFPGIVRLIKSHPQYTRAALKMLMAMLNNHSYTQTQQLGVLDTVSLILDQESSLAQLDSLKVGEELREELKGYLEKLSGKIKDPNIDSARMAAYTFSQIALLDPSFISLIMELILDPSSEKITKQVIEDILEFIREKKGNIANQIRHDLRSHLSQETDPQKIEWLKLIMKKLGYLRESYRSKRSLEKVL